jgi:hypothetical protein
VQADPIKPKLKLPGSKLLKLECGVLLSNVAFDFNLRRYNWDLVTLLLLLYTATVTPYEAGRLVRTSTRPTLNRRTEATTVYEHSHSR